MIVIFNFSEMIRYILEILSTLILNKVDKHIFKNKNGKHLNTTSRS